MAERLFIRLGRRIEQSCSWLVWAEQEKQIIASGELADARALATLSQRAGGRSVDILVPTSAVTLTKVQLPEKNQRQAIKALPFMLEENLAEDIADLHFVVGARDGEWLNVAVVAHEQMRDWLKWLNDAGIKIARIVPDCLALPLQGCRWAALKYDADYLLRTNTGEGVSLDANWWEATLEQLKMSLPTEEPITVADYSELAIEGVITKEQPLELPMLVLAKGILTAPLNLLSGIYTPKNEYGKHLLLWRNSVIVVVIALVLALVSKGLTIHQLNKQRLHLHDQTNAIFTKVVGDSRIVNVRAQIDTQLRQLQGVGSGSEFFSILQGLSGAFAKVPELKPTSLRFDGRRNQLRMQVSAKTYAQIEKFKTLAEKSFNVDAGTMNSNNDKVTSILTLRSR